MTFTAEWAELLTWQVAFHAASGTDEYGNRAWGPAQTVPAHVDRVTQGESPGAGEGRQGESTNAGTIFFDGITPSVGMMVVLPSGQDVYLSEVTEHIDEDGNHHHWECNWEVGDRG